MLKQPLHKDRPDYPVDFYKMADSSNFVESFCLILTNVLANPRLDSGTLLSAYFSIMCLFLPDLEEVCKSHLREKGMVVRDAILPDEVDTLFFRRSPSLRLSVIFVYFGQLALIGFKNINQANYIQYMSGRTRAMKSRIGVGVDQKIQICVPYAVAEKLGSKLVGARMFKKYFLMDMLDLKSDISPFPRMCDYVCNMLEWYEMSTIKFIYEALIITQSEVLFQPVVAYEVMQLQKMIFLMCGTTLPYYVRILGDLSEYQLFERSKVQVLADTSISILRHDRPSLLNFLSPMMARNTNHLDLVTRLANLHNTIHVQRGLLPAAVRALQFLGGGAPHIEEVEEVPANRNPAREDGNDGGGRDAA